MNAQTSKPTNRSEVLVPIGLELGPVLQALLALDVRLHLCNQLPGIELGILEDRVEDRGQLTARRSLLVRIDAAWVVDHIGDELRVAARGPRLESPGVQAPRRIFRVGGSSVEQAGARTVCEHLERAVHIAMLRSAGPRGVDTDAADVKVDVVRDYRGPHRNEGDRVKVGALGMDEASLRGVQSRVPTVVLLREGRHHKHRCDLRSHSEHHQTKHPRAPIPVDGAHGTLPHGAAGRVHRKCGAGGGRSRRCAQG
mmetsp:Transcript_35383/g.101757  ORF Transcript_35383/g.101757 Transcript_35383/m.101757 type:complete len:254 (-) Transcript_35383:15-776(-)